MDTGAEQSCMNLDTYEKLKINHLYISFVPTLKGATGHNMLAKGITTFDFTINEHTWAETLPYRMPSQWDGPGMVPKSYALMINLC